MSRLLFLLTYLAAAVCAQEPGLRTQFRLKYVAEGVVYLDGGRSSGLSEGMHLMVRRGEGEALAELVVTSVATVSAACEIRNSREQLMARDVAILSREDAELARKAASSEESRKYAQVVSFTEDDPLEEEQRASVQRPPLPEINRPRGRIGFEYGGTFQGGGAGNSSVTGFVFRGDVTRIGGSYWNLSGYWRGRINTRNSLLHEETLTDLMNRTYHLTLSYNNPDSRWVAGAGRLYLPWAASLETIDGGYLGRRVKRNITVGAFGGSTPDPTSWNYKPNRQLLGTFVNYTGGSFESAQFTSTAGVAVSRLSWKRERQFAFFENAVFYKQVFSVYHSMEVDQRKRSALDAGGSAQVTRSFVTLRLRPIPTLSVDLNHNHFRNPPTFDPRLIASGLVDRLLFQGVNVGFRLELPARSSIYANFGRSTRTGDARHSLNHSYGITKSGLFKIGLRADARYAIFDSNFGRGSYRSISLSREMEQAVRLELQAGDQTLSSGLTNQNRSRFVTAAADYYFSRHYFAGGGYTIYRSGVQDYSQVFMNLGYRF